MMDISRVVEVRAVHEGSGFLIAPSLIITARHVIKPGRGGVPRINVRLLKDYFKTRQNRDIPAELLWPPTLPDGDDVLDGNDDFALLRTLESVDSNQEICFSRLPEQSVIDVVAVGFPDISIFKRFLSRGEVSERDTKQITGKVNYYDNAKQREALGVGPFSIHLPMEMVPTKSSQSWRGMSGAGVLVGNRLVGIITKARDAANTHVIEALPVHRFLTMPDLVRSVGNANLVLPRQSEAGVGLRVNNIVELVHHIDRHDLSTNLAVKLDGFFTDPKAPLFLACRLCSDDEPANLFRRVRDRDLRSYAGNDEQFLVKEVNWPNQASTPEEGTAFLERGLKEALVKDPARRRKPFAAEDVAAHIPPGGTTLFVYSRIVLQSFGVVQRDILAWWETFWRDAAKAGHLKVIVFAVLEEETPLLECCKHTGRPCERGAAPLDESLPPDISPAWRLLRPITAVKQEDIRRWLNDDHGELPDLRDIDALTRTRLTAELLKYMPQRLRCVCLSLPRMLAEISHE